MPKAREVEHTIHTLSNGGDDANSYQVSLVYIQRVSGGASRESFPQERDSQRELEVGSWSNDTLKYTCLQQVAGRYRFTEDTATGGLLRRAECRLPGSRHLSCLLSLTRYVRACFFIGCPKTHSRFFGAASTLPAW